MRILISAPPPPTVASSREPVYFFYNLLSRVTVVKEQEVGQEEGEKGRLPRGSEDECLCMSLGDLFFFNFHLLLQQLHLHTPIY